MDPFLVPVSPSPQGPVCRMLPPRAQSLRRSFVLGARACLANGWDVVDVEEAHLDDDTWAVLSGEAPAGKHRHLHSERSGVKCRKRTLCGGERARSQTLLSRTPLPHYPQPYHPCPSLACQTRTSTTGPHVGAPLP